MIRFDNMDDGKRTTKDEAGLTVPPLLREAGSFALPLVPPRALSGATDKGTRVHRLRIRG